MAVDRTLDVICFHQFTNVYIPFIIIKTTYSNSFNILLSFVNKSTKIGPELVLI